MSDSKADRLHQDLVINSAISEANLEADMRLKGVNHISRMDCPGDNRCQCCIGCKRPLTEFEFEYYENRRHLDRLCKSCVLEERAR